MLGEEFFEIFFFFFFEWRPNPFNVFGSHKTTNLMVNLKSEFWSINCKTNFFVVVLFSKISKTVSNSPSPSVLGEHDSWVYVQGPQPCHSHPFLVHSFRESHDTHQVKNNISSFQIFSLKIYNRIKLKAKSLRFCVVYILYFVCFIFKNNYILNYSIVFEYLTHIHETWLKRYVNILLIPVFWPPWFPETKKHKIPQNKPTQKVKVSVLWKL